MGECSTDKPWFELCTSYVFARKYLWWKCLYFCNFTDRPSMMSNALVNVANLGAIIEGSVSLMLNHLTGVPGLCGKKI